MDTNVVNSQDCGYSIDNEKQHKKPHNLIIINLISPRIDYKSHSKSNIELKPFADNVLRIFTSFVNLITTNKNKNSNSNGNKIP